MYREILPPVTMNEMVNSEAKAMIEYLKGFVWLILALSV